MSCSSELSYRRLVTGAPEIVVRQAEVLAASHLCWHLKWRQSCGTETFMRGVCANSILSALNWIVGHLVGVWELVLMWQNHMYLLSEKKIHTFGVRSAIRKTTHTHSYNGILFIHDTYIICATAWMNFENTMLNKRIQIQQVIYYMIPFIWKVQNRWIQRK